MLLSTLLLTLFPSVYGFSFSVSSSEPTQCGQISIDWVGGTPPFRLIVMPAYDYPSNISIPDSAWDGDSGSYLWTVNYPADTNFVLLMSDSTGIGTGGVSPLYTVEASRNSSACTQRSSDVDFYFYLNETSVTQCSPVQIYWDDTAVAPVTILGAIPGGQPFMFQSPDASDHSLDWKTNIAAGSQFILSAFDAGTHGSGGSSNLLTVGGSGSSACLDDSSPSSTPVSNPTATSTGGTGTSNGGVKTVTAITTATAKGAAGLSTGAIAGIAVAAIAIVLVLQGALFYFCCRRQFAALLSHRRQMREREVKAGGVDLADDTHSETGDRPTSLHNVRSRDTSSLLDGRRGPRSRSSIDGESSISPYWDLGQNSRAGQSPYRGPFDTPPDEDFAPPHFAHSRNDSTSSSDAPHLPLDIDSSPSLLTLPHFAPMSTQPSLPPGAAPSQSKSQMAASLAAQNPDGDGPSGTFGGRQPRAHAPPGGFRMHEDAGRVDADVEDLPPMYRPEWESESRRGSTAENRRSADRS